MPINNVEDLRNHMLKTLEQLSNGKIEIEEASVAAKCSETIMSSIKMELAYANMKNEEPEIKFLENTHRKAKQKSINKV